MNAKRNALEIVRFAAPERIAMGPPCYGLSYVGCNHEGYAGGGHHLPVGSQWTDIWGTVWHREHDGVMGFPRGHPLADLPSALGSYQWPDPDDERICASIYDQLAGCDREETFLFGSHRDTVWEKAYMLVGMEDLMCYFSAEPDAVRELLHRIMDFQLGIARHYAACGVEMVGMTDDLGTQRALLLSPDTIAEFLVPEYRRLFAFHKERGALVSFHSCGHVVPILDVFIDLGVDVLNPVQASANDLDEVRRKTRGRVALQGGVPSGLIAAGPVSAIRETAIDLMWRLGRDGGYFCSADQGMPWPEKHYRALEEAVAEYGRYPLVPPGRTARPANTERVQGR